MSRLILRGNNITGTITRSIGNMTELEMLDLSYNKFYGEIPSSIGRLLKLQTLNLASNRLTSIPEELYELRGLKALSLFNNRIIGLISTSIGNLIDLETLQLQINFFDPQCLPQEICQLRSLRNIDVSRIRLIGPFPDCLYGMTNLRSFLCEGNNVAGTLSESFGNMTSLISLNLAYSNLFGTLPASLGNLSMVEALTFSGNFFSGPVPRSFEKLVKLSELSLQGNGFTGKIDFLANLNIILFYLHWNLFTGHFKVPEGGLQSILYLDVSANLLSGPVPFNTLWERIEGYEVYHNYFSSTLPSFKNISQMLIMTAISNYLTSTIPPELFDHTQRLYYVGLSENLLTGTIPPAMLQFPALNQLFLGQNFLTGTLPDLKNSTFLVVLDVSSNLLHGRPADSLRHVEFIEQLFLEENLFTGPIHELVNITFQKQLVNIDLSANEFTGTIPRDVFLYANKLTTFAASNNCLDGDIPEEICKSNSLVSLSLDGLTTSSNCRDLFFPGLPLLTGFAASHFVKSPIPPCIYELPNLELLHLSGNGLTGTIPNTVNFSSSLTNLALSHNALTGTIPEAIQLRQWFSLDLSYNKLSGTLSSNFEIPPSNSSTSLEVNRLSGRIPSALIHGSTNINILSGNIFTCNLIGSDLPSSDPDAKSYSCGSDNANNVLYLWVGTVFFVPLMVFFLLRFFSQTLLSLRGMFNEVWEKCNVWRNALRENDNRVNLIRLSIYFSEVRQSTWKLTAYCILILIPLYSVLKVYSSSYYMEYAWSVSAVLMNGETAAIVLFFTSTVFVVFYVIILKEIVRKLNVRMPKDRCPSLPLVTARGHFSTGRALTYSLVFFFDLVLMLLADFSYVFIVISYDTLVATLAALTLALFRFATNHLILWYALPWSSEFLYWMKMRCVRTTDNNISCKEMLEFTASDISFLENLTLFNNIIIPGLAIVFILPDCFYNVLFSANDIVSYYNYEVCYQHAPVSGYSHLCYPHIRIDSYSPPFLYSFQCSSKIIINYVPVYVLLFLIATVIPFMKIILKLIYQAYDNQKDVHSQRLCAFIEPFLPEYFKDFRQKEPRESQGEKKRRLFSKLSITVQINSYLTILMCFGVLFPPLALIAAIAIFALTYFEEVCIGWVLTETRRLGAGFEWYEEQIERECEGVEESSNLTIWSTLVVSCCMYGFLIFDTMGDSSGGEGALPMTLVMVSMPVLCYGGLGLYRRWKRSESTGTVKAERKEDIEGGVEMMIEESSISLRGGPVGSGRMEGQVEIELLPTKELCCHLSNTDDTKDLAIVNNPIQQRK